MANLLRAVFVSDDAIDRTKSISKSAVYLIYALIGLSIFIFDAQESHFGKLAETQYVFIISVILGPFSGILAGLLLASIFYKITDSFTVLKDDVTGEIIWKSMAIVNFPLLLLGIFTFVEFLIYGDIIFSKIDVIKFMGDSSSIYYYVLEVLKIIVMCWTFYFTLKVLSKRLEISFLQVFIANLLCAVLVYGFSKIIMYILYLILR